MSVNPDEPSCRSCGARGLRQFLSLGPLPLTDAYIPSEKADAQERRFPLDVVFCPKCTLVQITVSVPPEEMFEDYAYYSSVSETLAAHSREHVQELILERRLGPDSLVLEIASNDGYLLRNFVEAGIPVLGIDPARGPAEAAEASGVPTLVEFFGDQLAERLRSNGRLADVILLNNVLAHVPDLNGFVEGIRILLAEHGVAEIEAPYVRDLVENLEFDTIYHEHLCYFSVTALDGLFRRHGLSLNRVRHLPIHGGSLRLTVAKKPAVTHSVRTYLDREAAEGLNRFQYYQGFADRVHRAQSNLRELLTQLKRAGKSVAAYGAAAKGTILLNSSGIGADLIDFVADKSPYKQGKLLPGARIPIEPPESLVRKAPGYVVLLAWNLEDEIVREQHAYLESGGTFIVPIPIPTMVGARGAPRAIG